MYAEIVSNFASRHPFPLSHSYFCQTCTVILGPLGEISPKGLMDGTTSSPSICKTLSAFTSWKVLFFSNKCYEIYIKVIISVQWKLSPVWKDWDSSIQSSACGLPIPGPTKPWNHEPCPGSSTPLLLPLPTYHKAWSPELTGTFEKCNSKKQNRNKQDTSLTEQKITKCCWQDLTPILSILASFKHRFFSPLCIFLNSLHVNFSCMSEKLC